MAVPDDDPHVDAATDLAIVWLREAGRMPMEVVATAATIVLALELTHAPAEKHEGIIAAYVTAIRRAEAVMRLGPRRVVM